MSFAIFGNIFASGFLVGQFYFYIFNSNIYEYKRKFCISELCCLYSPFHAKDHLQNK